MSRHHPRRVRSSLRIPGIPVLAGILLAVASGAPPARADKEGDWPEITAEEKALSKLPQDPDADGVYLDRERNGRITRKGNDLVNVLDYHVRYKILTERGKRHGEVRIPAQKFSRVSNIRARTVKADGTVVPVPADQIFEKTVLQIGDFKVTEWVFTFPAMEPGAILEYRYDRHDNFLFFIDPFYFEGPEYTRRAKVTQIFPGDMGYMALADLCNVQPQVSDWRMGKEKGKLYSLELRDLQGYRDELLMPPAREVSPRLELVLQSWKGVYWMELDRRDVLFGDWASVAKLMDGRYQKVIKEGQAALKPIVEGWVQGLSEPQEKIKAIARRVQEEFRYIPWTSVGGGSRKIETLLKEKSADNEEKAVLLAAALKVVGIDTQLAAVSGKHAGSLNPKFFSLSQFTHVVVGIPQDGGSHRWIDPTVSYAPFGFVPWHDAGATAMLLKDGKGEILDLPQKNEVSAARYRSTVKPRPDGKADVEIEAEFTGEYAIDLRNDLVPAADTARLTFLQGWVARKRPGSALKSHAIENLQDVEKPLRVKLAIEAPGLVTLADETTLVRGCVLTCEDSNPLSRRARQHAFYVDRGWNEEETVMIQPGAAMQVETPPPASARSEVASLTFSCLAQGDGARCTRQFTARRNRWPATVQENLRKMYDKVVETDRSTVALQPGAPGTAAGGR